ncbi:uncharacterized protein LOC142351955 isoform X2 [Convolutriloba macropyga]
MSRKMGAEKGFLFRNGNSTVSDPLVQELSKYAIECGDGELVGKKAKQVMECVRLNTKSMNNNSDRGYKCYLRILSECFHEYSEDIFDEKTMIGSFCSYELGQKATNKECKMDGDYSSPESNSANRTLFSNFCKTLWHSVMFVNIYFKFDFCIDNFGKNTLK